MNRGLRIGSGARLGGLGAFGVKGGGASDTTPPTVTITSTASTITAAAFTCTFTLSEVSVNFALGDITVGNGSAGTFAGSGMSYTAVITPTATGLVTVDVAGGAFTDAAGNNNTAATQFSILYISALMWIKADLGTGGVNDGDLVTTWTDQSGNSNSPTQSGADSLKPLYKTNILNSLPVVRGDGSNDFLKKAFTLNQPYTIFLVFKLITEAFGKTIFDGATSSEALFDQTSTVNDTFRIYAGAELAITHPAIGSFEIATFRVNGASSRVSIGASSNSGNAGAGNATGIEIFAKGDNSSNSNTDIAEMMVFAGAMADATMNKVGAYLGTKWGLTWTNF